MGTHQRSKSHKSTLEFMNKKLKSSANKKPEYNCNTTDDLPFRNVKLKSHNRPIKLNSILKKKEKSNAISDDLPKPSNISNSSSDTKIIVQNVQNINDKNSHESTLYKEKNIYVNTKRYENLNTTRK